MKNDALDSLVTRLYRAAMSISDAGWQELLKNSAFSLLAAEREPGAALVAAVALTDTVLVLAEHARHLDRDLTAALRQGLRDALGKPATPSLDAGLGASAR